MTNEEIRLRLAGGEDSRTQFKREPIGVAKLAAELTAFTNAEGGVIFFGVNDDGSVVGLDAAQKKMLNDELSNASNDHVRPAVYPRTEFHVIDGRQILAVIVSEGTGVQRALELGANVDLISDRELNLFKVVLYPSKGPGLTTPQNTPQNTPQKLGLSQRILEVIVKDKSVTIQGMADQLGLSRETVKEYVAKLKANGQLKRIGSDRSGHWEVVSEG